MKDSKHPIVWLRHAEQRLGVVPSLGGGVAAWQFERHPTPFDVFRPWDGNNVDRYSLASFVMLPWCNRVSGGGFEHEGQFHAIAANRCGEHYPIHGDGWLQPWNLTRRTQDTVQMTLDSHCHGGNPHRYHATQTFRLVEGGLEQTLSVTHLGNSALPYGLGIHPWFPVGRQTRLAAAVQGVWLTGESRLPTVHTSDFPTAWDLRAGIAANGPLIDNAYTGWSGKAAIRWPEEKLQLNLTVSELQSPDGPGACYCMLYRSPKDPTFCLEPVSHTVDAFHEPARYGLQVLGNGQSMSLHALWQVTPLL